MGEDGRYGVPPTSIPLGDSAPTEPIAAVTDLVADWWDPAWDATWWDPIPGVPAGDTTEPGTCASRPDAHADLPPSVANMSPNAPAEPSWGRVFATTISLWASRRFSDVSAGWGHRAVPQSRRQFRRPSWRLPRLLAASMLGAGLLAVGAATAGLVMASGAAGVPLPARPSPVPVPSGRALTPAWLATVQQTARPVSLTIPAIGVRTAVVDLGLNPGGTLQVPASTTVAGWYTGSPQPGAVGSAVIAGHVDSRAGPAVFFWLRNMRPGERVYVKRADGTLAVFTVTSVQIYAKDNFPTAAVYGPVPDAELRLITCGGAFDDSLGSYLSNVVVYARLTG
jgi:sortase (surface protein transpeptidase)